MTDLRFADIRVHTRRLPHWELEEGRYFVTFRLPDSLRTPLQKRTWKQTEQQLDAGEGSCWLLKPEIAQIVADAIRHFDGQRYRLLAWSIMPNHVHVVFEIGKSHTLAQVLHSWKSYSANLALKALNTPPPFWQREYWDRLIRSDEELGRAIDYVVVNPEKAGLKNWQWVWVHSELRG